jgi:hypothetical protein
VSTTNPVHIFRPTHHFFFPIEVFIFVLSCFVLCCSAFFGNRRMVRAANLAYFQNHPVGGSNPMGRDVLPQKPMFASLRRPRFAHSVQTEPTSASPPSPPPLHEPPLGSTPVPTPAPTEPYDPTNVPQYPPPSYNVV